MQAVIISIGDELVLGQTVDTNAAWLSGRLAEVGVDVRYHHTVADDLETIAWAMREAATHVPLVLVTGGLGPTDDDLTREALAEVLQQPLLRDEDAMALIQKYFDHIQRPMTKRNEVQAMRPASTSIIPNSVGTAPGLQATLDGASIFIMPGVPSEMRAMYNDHIQPVIGHMLAAGSGKIGDRSGGAEGGGGGTGGGGRVILTRTIHTFGRGESNVATMLGSTLTARDRNPIVGTTVSNGLVSIRVRSTAENVETARQQLDDTVAEVEQTLGSLVFGRDDATLEGTVVQMLLDLKKTVATAESCTAGLVAKLLTDSAGASGCFVGGYVVYSNEAKRRDLDVPSELIEQHGAVSEPVAIALAENARARAGADFALSLTGIAGPSGGTEAKPVGTVWIALAERDQATAAKKHHLAGNRATVRDRAAKLALDMLRLRL
ncbi:MAG: nicotinamide-nucleotide amidohydrolase family protein [Phycisphaeraceae bacterium]